MKKLSILIAVFISMFSVVLNAKEMSTNSGYNYFYKGNIGKRDVVLSIRMLKDFYSTDTIKGFYYFTDTKENINFSGSSKGDTLSIKETTTGNSYELTIKENKSIVGKNKKNEQIELTLLPEINTVNIIQYSGTEEEKDKEFNQDREFIYNIEDLKIENTNNIKSINTVNKKLKGSFDTFKKEIDKNMSLFKTEPIANYQYLYKLNVSYIDTNIIVFLENKYVYTGGANGLSYITPKMYSLKSGSEISSKTSSIIKNKKDEKLVDMMRQKLLKLNNEDMYFDFNSILLPNTFYISSSGITFVYSLYEIAPRVAGIIEITFTFEEIKPFMSKVKNIEYLFN